MDFALADEQAAVISSIALIIERQAGPDRIRELGGDDPAYDTVLDEALTGAGFTSIGREPDAGPLEAALILEAVSAGLGTVALGAAALVVPGVTDQPLEGPVALTTSDHDGLVRYAADARTILVLDAARGRVRILSDQLGQNERVASRFGYPMGRIATPEGSGETLLAASAQQMLDWWRVALAAEMAGTMRAALARTVAYVSDRTQFGRAVGAFQAVQHRLAETSVAAEGARWLAFEAAWLGAPPEAAAAAITHATGAARRVISECHQLTGAIGFTTEYGLHFWTMRLAALAVEAAWMAPPERDLVLARWGSDRTPDQVGGGPDADRPAV